MVTVREEIEAGLADRSAEQVGELAISLCNALVRTDSILICLVLLYYNI